MGVVALGLLVVAWLFSGLPQARFNDLLLVVALLCVRLPLLPTETEHPRVRELPALVALPPSLMWQSVVARAWLLPVIHFGGRRHGGLLAYLPVLRREWEQQPCLALLLHELSPDIAVAGLLRAVSWPLHKP